MTTHVILNPAAGRGRGERLLLQIRSRFSGLPHVEFASTESSGDEERLAADAIAKGARNIIAVGGDGTCAKIANAILKSGRACRLAVVPAGTGNDFAKTLGVLTLSPGAIAQLVADGESTLIDVGLADGHYFVNTCGFGFDASVLAATKKVRFLKGDAVYIYSALRQLFSYRGIAISTDGALKTTSERMLMAVASNGQWLGGAFRIAPTASVTDGKLDFCVFGDTNVLGRARRFAGALRGTHLTLPGVTGIKSDSLTLTFSDSPAMEMDGELIQASSRTVKIECVPRALAVYAAPGALA